MTVQTQILSNSAILLQKIDNEKGDLVYFNNLSLSNPLTINHWNMVKAILTQNVTYSKKCFNDKFQFFSEEEKQEVYADYTAFSIQNYLEVNWDSFLFEDGGKHAHNVLLQFILFLGSRLKTIMVNDLPKFHQKVSEYVSSNTLSNMSLQEILHFYEREFVRFHKNHIDFKEKYFYCKFSCNSFYPLLDDGNYRFFMLFLLSAELVNGMNYNSCRNSDTIYFPNPNGFGPKLDSKYYQNLSQILVSKYGNIAIDFLNWSDQSGQDLGRVYTITSTQLVDEMFTEEEIKEVTDDPLKYYFEKLNAILNIAMPAMVGNYYHDRYVSVLNNNDNRKKSYLLIETNLAKFKDEISNFTLDLLTNPDPKFEDFEKKFMKNYYTFQKFFQRSLYLEFCENNNFFNEELVIQMIDIVPKRIWKEILKELTSTDSIPINISTNTIIEKEEVKIDDYQLEVELVMLSSQTPLGTNVETQKSTIIKEKKEKPKLFNDFFIYNNKNIDSHCLNHSKIKNSISALNQIAVITNSLFEQNDTSFLDKFLSILLFQENYELLQRLSFKKIQSFRTDKDKFKKDDIEITLTDQYRIFLREIKGNQIMIVHLGNPPYHD